MDVRRQVLLASASHGNNPVTLPFVTSLPRLASNGPSWETAPGG